MTPMMRLLYLRLAQVCDTSRPLISGMMLSAKIKSYFSELVSKISRASVPHAARQAQKLALHEHGEQRGTGYVVHHHHVAGLVLVQRQGRPSLWYFVWKVMSAHLLQQHRSSCKQASRQASS